MIKEEMAFVNIVRFTITADLGNLGYLGYLYIRVGVRGSATREKYEEERKYQYSCKY